MDKSHSMNIAETQCLMSVNLVVFEPTWKGPAKVDTRRMKYWLVKGKITATATTLLQPLPRPPLPPPSPQATANAGTTVPQHQFSIGQLSRINFFHDAIRSNLP